MKEVTFRRAYIYDTTHDKCAICKEATERYFCEGCLQAIKEFLPVDDMDFKYEVVRR